MPVHIDSSRSSGESRDDAYGNRRRRRCVLRTTRGHGKTKWPRAFARDHFVGDPSGIRTRVTAVRGRRTRPLYDGAVYISVLLPAFPLIKLSDSFTHFALVSNRRTG